MKNFKILSAFLVLFAAVNMTSCGDTEPVDESIVIPIPTIPGQPAPGDCANPIGFQVSNFIGTSVNLSWVAGSDETSWEVEYGPAGFNIGTGTTEMASASNLNIAGLNASNSYDFYVRGVCLAGGYSNWVGPVSIGEGGSSTDCGMPTEVTAVRNEANLTQVTVAWIDNGEAGQWEIEYGFVGFTPGTGTSVISNSTTKILTGIIQNQDYHVWVQSICGPEPEDRSNWAGPFLVESINSLTAKVNNVTFVPTEVIAELTTVDEINYIKISADNVDGDNISVLIDKSLPLGTYNLPPDMISTYTFEGVEYTANAVVPSTVTITQKTPHSLVGTFSFTVVDDTGATLYAITNGTFAVRF